MKNICIELHLKIINAILSVLPLELRYLLFLSPLLYLILRIIVHIAYLCICYLFRCIVSNPVIIYFDSLVESILLSIYFHHNNISNKKKHK